MKKIVALSFLLGLLFCSQCFGQWIGADKGAGFLCRPQIYVNNEPDFPLTGLGVLMPEPGQLLPDIDVSGISADHWNRDGVNVQPGLNVDTNWIRAGFLRGFKGGWAAGISIPWYRNIVQGSIGGFPASGVAEGFGNIMLGGKKIIWENCNRGTRLIFAAGIELPTGVEKTTFAENNIVTNGYFEKGQRIPLGWQPSNSSFNGLLALSYGKSWKRFSWQILAAGKINGIDDEDVHVGNVFISSVDGTYGISRRFAGSLGFTYRAQESDSYPNSPLPVNGPLLDGTTCHSPILYLDLGLRYSIMGKVTVGFGVRTPIMEPSAGMDPTTQFSVILYPDVD